MLMPGQWIVLAAILGFAILLIARMEDRLKAQTRRIEELEAELKTWTDEAAEIEDESEEARFSRAIHTLCAEEDESTADRIASELAALGVPAEAARDLVLRELRRAWR